MRIFKIRWWIPTLPLFCIATLHVIPYYQAIRVAELDRSAGVAGVPWDAVHMWAQSAGAPPLPNTEAIPRSARPATSTPQTSLSPPCPTMSTPRRTPTSVASSTRGNCRHRDAVRIEEMLNYFA